MRYILVFFLFLSMSSYSQELTKDEKKQKRMEQRKVKDSLNALKNVHAIGLPLVDYNRSIGLVLGALGMMTYRYDKKDTLSPKSRLGLLAVVSTSKTWGVAMFQDNYLKQDKWRFNWFLGYFSYNFQFFSNIPTDGNGKFIPYQTDQFFFETKTLRKVVGKFYAGINTDISYAKTKIADSLDLKEKWLNSFGISLQFDTRNDQNYPTKGWNLEYTGSHHFKFMGNENYFYGLDLVAHNFTSINSKMVFASRFRADLKFGSKVPFEAQNHVGRTDIRGYSNGRFRGNQLYALQTEFRYMFAERWGCVAFAGVASSFDHFNQVNWNYILPGVGAGFRFKILKEDKINLGVDVAVGKGDWGVYIRIREAF